MAASLAGEDLSRQTSTSSRRSWRASSVREMFNAPDVFQRSSRQQEVNDEEELRWAAIERLPTYDRLRKGMLMQVTSNGNVVRDEVDVTKLGPQAKKQLMESILKVVEDDNERFLTRLRSRTDRLIQILFFLYRMPFFFCTYVREWKEMKGMLSLNLATCMFWWTQGGN